MASPGFEQQYCKMSKQEWVDKIDPLWKMKAAYSCQGKSIWKQHDVLFIFIKNQKASMGSPGFEQETFSALDWRDNQLHHKTFW